MYTKITISTIAAATAALALGCTPSDGGDPPEEYRQGMVVHSDMQYTDDVGGFTYTVSEVDCASGDPIADGANESVTIGRDQLFLPNGIPAFDGKPFDPASEHIFGDHYFLLPVGCYDVTSQPLKAESEENSESCYAGHARKVEVVDGLTTEIVLISQCLGPGRGGLDVVTTLNHPPVLEDLVFEPSKFVSSCNGVEICVTAVDPDGDPIEFAWEQTAGETFARGPEVTQTTLNDDGTITQCVVLQTGSVGDYEMKVSAYDLAFDEGGELARIEELLAAQGDPAESHDDLLFPVYAGVECPIVGKSVVMVLTLHGPEGETLSPDLAVTLAGNAVDYVTPPGVSDPRILLVHDYNNHNEDNADVDLIAADLKMLYGDANVTVLDPVTILRSVDVDGYDVVWFSNPGWPMGNVTSQPTTFNTLVNFRGAGGGLILQGDDITQSSTGSLPLMETLTYVKFNNNGTNACGVGIDNWGANSYTVTFDDDSANPLLAGLAGESFEYHNDVDHATPLGLGEDVLASAAVTGAPNCAISAPALIAIDPAKISAPVPSSTP
jgi:hypothetical protein